MDSTDENITRLEARPARRPDSAQRVGPYRLVREERALAEARFDDVRQLANAALFDLHDAIRELPGAIPARQLLVSKGMAYLDKLARDAGDRADLQRELASGISSSATSWGARSTRISATPPARWPITGSRRRSTRRSAQRALRMRRCGASWPRPTCG